MDDSVIDWGRVSVIAFDLFGTVFDMSGVPRDEIKAYADHIRKPEWSPLKLPDSWEAMPAFRDSADGIKRLRRLADVVTCSNAPLGFQIGICKDQGIFFDGLIPLELNRAYKTNPKAYMTVCDVLDTPPTQVLLVTANKDFGDIEASRALGMQAVLIRGESRYKTIIDLAEEAAHD